MTAVKNRLHCIERVSGDVGSFAVAIAEASSRVATQKDEMRVTRTIPAGVRAAAVGFPRHRWCSTFGRPRPISDEIFREEEARLSQEITFAKMELRAARIDDMDVTAVLEFAEVLVTNAGRLWDEASLDQRLRLQDALFPKGVTHSTASGFGTAETSLIFEWLRDNPARDSGEVSPTGFEPVLPA